MSGNIILISILYFFLMRKNIINFVWLPGFVALFVLIKENFKPYRRLDDVTYFENGEEILQSFLNNFPDFNEVIYLSKGIHFGYYLYCGVLKGYFNFTYSDITFFNCIILALTLPKIDLIFRKEVSKFLYFSPVLFTFPIVLNVKDALLVSLTIICVEKLLYRKHLHDYFILVVLFLFMLSLRFYLPFLLVLWLSIKKISENRLVYSTPVFFIMLITFVIEILLPGQFEKFLNINIILSVTAFFKFIISPLPWSLEGEYGFLLIYSIFSLIRSPFILFALIVFLLGGFKKYRLIMYFVLLNVLFFAAFPELNGPRQRLMLEPFLSGIALISLLKLGKIFAYNPHN